MDDAAADIQVVDGGTDALVDGGEPVDAPAADVPTPDVVIVPTDAGGGCATFVSLAGNDDNTGTSESPLRTLTEALAGPGGVICVTTGTYSETLEITRPVVFRGGYTNFDEVPTGRSTVAGISSGHLVRGVRAEFERFSLTAQTASDRGTSSAALRAIEAVLVLRDVLLIPGNGARGDDGPPGENGGRGDDASDGLFADPPNSCSRGGGRGNGGTRTFQPGSGNPGAGPLGGTGGLAGRSQNSPTPGGNGGPGAANPGVGGVGAGGGELGALTSDALYRPAGGQDGEDGPPGGGGGGGGGGGADSGGSINFGGTGGHGGGGGCGGAGGGGGGGGGGSFGIVAVSSTIELVEVTVTRGGGGAGGNGRTGGSGGAGGSGAPGTSDFVTTAGGNGGNGGNGGRGGQGGGGGGGPSLGYLVDASTTLIGAPTAAAGFAGNGGGGGATGSRGLFDVGAVTSVE